MDNSRAARKARTMALYEYFNAAPGEFESDDFVIALGMTLAEELAAQFPPELWTERVATFAELLMADLLGNHPTQTMN